MAKRKHWTQTPAGKKKIAAAKNWGRPKKTEPTKKKMTNGSGKKPAKAEVMELARAGARQRLQDIERERQKLLIFLDEPHDA
jgi:hypothetical protein